MPLGLLDGRNQNACNQPFHGTAPTSTHTRFNRPAGVVDVCLIPEIPFDLDKLCDFVKSIMDRKDHCVVCVAEGGWVGGWVGCIGRGGRRAACCAVSSTEAGRTAA